MLVTVFADASWCPRKRVAGWSGWARSDRGRTWGGSELRLAMPEAYLAEVCAVVRSVKLTLDGGVARTGDRLLLQSDCLQVKAVLWRRRLSPPGTDRRRVEDLALDTFTTLTNRYRFTCGSRHVKGHNGRAVGPRSFLNERCDQVARSHMTAARARLSAETG